MIQITEYNRRERGKYKNKEKEQMRKVGRKKLIETESRENRVWKNIRQKRK